MKIVHVITRLILGGAQENTLLTCEGLHARGHDVTLVTGPAIGPEGELMTRARRGGYRIIELPAMRREIHPLRDRAVYHALVRLLCELAPDVVHTHSSKAGILARKAAAEANRELQIADCRLQIERRGNDEEEQGAIPKSALAFPAQETTRHGQEARETHGRDPYGQAAHATIKIVHTVHGLPFHPYQSALKNWLYVAMERRAARRTDAIISVADAMTQQALSAGVGKGEQYVTIYSGMETDLYSKPAAGAAEFRASLKLPVGAVLVTQVSRLAELKGHEYIIEAAAELDSRIHFCFVGDGHWRKRIEAWIARMGLSDRFHLTGLIAPGQIPAAMQASDIVVHCSLREGLARALPQAMLAEKPVISFDVDGASEVVDESTGVLLAPRDIPGLRAAIQALAWSPSLRAKMGQAGKKKCMVMFDHRTMVQRIEELYGRLLG